MSPAEIRESVSEILKRRLFDPFLGTFATTFLIWNWKALFTLAFDTDPMRWKIQVVTQTYWNTPGLCLVAFLGPMAIACAWYFGYPYLRRRLVLYHDRQILETVKQQSDLADLQDFESRVLAREREFAKSKALEERFVELFLKQNPDSDMRDLHVVECTEAEPGDWVRWSGRKAKLAYMDANVKVLANGIVVDKFSGGFVLIQGAGRVSPSIFKERLKKGFAPGTTYLLDREPGGMMQGQTRPKGTQTLMETNEKGQGFIKLEENG